MTWPELTTLSRIVTQLVFLAVVLAGCATVDPYASPPMSQNLQREDDVGYCARLFADIDRRIDSLGVRDAEAHRIAGFPYLRVDRFSAALSRRATTADATASVARKIAASRRNRAYYRVGQRGFEYR